MVLVKVDLVMQSKKIEWLKTIINCSHMYNMYSKPMFDSECVFIISRI